MAGIMLVSLFLKEEDKTKKLFKIRKNMKKIFTVLLLIVMYLEASVINLTDRNYEAMIKEKKEVVILFSAPWCGACRKMKPIYEKLDSSWSEKIIFMKINTDENKELTTRFGISALPTMIVFKDGKEVSRSTGSLDKFELMQFLRPKEAFDLYTKECTVGNTKACVDLGEAYEKGKVVKKDYAKSLNFYTQACEKSSAKGCAYLAYLYDESMGVKQDNQKTIKYYKKGCDGDYAWSCDKLGDIYYYGYNDAKIDFNISFPLYKKACNLGRSSACYSLGLSYDNGNGVEQDYQKAIRVYTNACDDDEISACYNLGVLYSEGRGTITNEKKALELYDKGCSENDMDSCFNMAFLYTSGKQIEHEYKKARYFSQKACDENHIGGCTLLGYLLRNALGGERDLKKAKELYTFSCEKKNETACRNLKLLNASMNK